MLGFCMHINQHSIRLKWHWCFNILGIWAVSWTPKREMAPYFVYYDGRHSKVCKWAAWQLRFCPNGNSLWGIGSQVLKSSLRHDETITAKFLDPSLDRGRRPPAVGQAYTLRVFASCHLIFKIEFKASFYLSANGMKINVLLSKRPPHLLVVIVAARSTARGSPLCLLPVH